MDVLITLTSAGANTGPFDLYANTIADPTVFTDFDNNVPKADLLAGYMVNIPWEDATIVKVVSDNIDCPNSIYIPIQLEATTTTTTSTSTTTTTTTTLPAMSFSNSYDCESDCAHSSGNIKIDGAVVYTWTASTPLPETDTFYIAPGSTVAVSGDCWISGIGCIGAGEVSRLVLYIDGVSVEAIDDGHLSYSFVYANEASMEILTTCYIP